MLVKICVFVTTQIVVYVLTDVLNSLSSRTTELMFKQEMPTHWFTSYFSAHFSIFDAHFQAVRVLKSSRSLTITVLTGAVSTLS